MRNGQGAKRLTGQVNRSQAAPRPEGMKLHEGSKSP